MEQTWTAWYASFVRSLKGGLWLDQIWDVLQVLDESHSIKDPGVSPKSNAFLLFFLPEKEAKYLQVFKSMQASICMMSSVKEGLYKPPSISWLQFVVSSKLRNLMKDEILWASFLWTVI